MVIASAGGPNAVNVGAMLGVIAAIVAPTFIVALFRFVGKTRLRAGPPSGKGIEWIDRRRNW
jgi:hypothetical protein